MKKLFVLLFVALTVILALSSCQGEHTHNYSEWEVTKAATCAENGEKVRYCSCGEKQTETIAPTIEHNYSTEYNFDEASHWLECKDCGAAKDMAEHQLSGDSICAVCNMMMPTEGIVYQISDDGKYAIVTGYTGTASKVKIADTYQGLPVKNIYDNAFYENKTITSVIIPDSVVTISDFAFIYCFSLTSVVIPDNVTSIGYSAFEYCYNLTSVVIPDSVTSIGNSAFANCFKLQFNEYENCKYLGSEDNPYFALIQVTTQNLSSYTIHEDTKVIAGRAFQFCSSLTSVVIGDSVTSISSSAFEGCSNLTSVVIGNSVTSIGGSAFKYCSSLTSINVDEKNNNYKSIDGNLYSKDGKTLIQYAIGKQDESFTIQLEVTTIGECAFEGCSNLTSVVIPDSVTSIGECAFGYCHVLKSVVIPNSVTSIGGWAFLNCPNLTSVVIGNSVTSISSSAFAYCSSLTSINVDEKNNNYKSIDGNLYSKDGKTLIQYAIGKQDESFTIPLELEVTTIGDSAFEYCSNLTSVVIGDSVTSIGEYAFYDCYALSDVYYTGTEEEWKAIVIDNDSNWDLIVATIHYNHVA